MTFREYMKNANARLDMLAEEAERARNADEEFVYEARYEDVSYPDKLRLGIVPQGK